MWKEGKEEARGTYSCYGFQREIISNISCIIQQCSVRLKREPWCDPSDVASEKGDVCEIEEEGPAREEGRRKEVRRSEKRRGWKRRKEGRNADHKISGMHTMWMAILIGWEWYEA